MAVNRWLSTLKGGLVVSCQAPKGSPLDRPDILAEIARSCALGGACAVRADGPDNIRAIRASTNLPVLGIYKVWHDSGRPVITPDSRHELELIMAGAQLVAMEATEQFGPPAAELEQRIRRLHERFGVEVVADVSTFEEGLRAWQAGADAVATTLSGYTPYSRQSSDPDIELVRRLAAAGIRVIAEGRIRKPEQAAEALRAGAWAVVVGDAITNPLAITSWFVHAIRREVDLDDVGLGDRWGAD